MEKRQRKVRKTIRKGTVFIIAVQWTSGIGVTLLILWGGLVVAWRAHLFQLAQFEAH